MPVSIDTTKASVARAALDAGAALVNDVSGGTADPDMLPLVASEGAGFVVMHMRGDPRSMQQAARYDDVTRDVATALAERVDGAIAAGVDPRAILADPGIGFAKTGTHNRALLHALPELAQAVGVPLLVGASRKSFLGAILGDAEADREAATLAVTVWCFELGAAVPHGRAWHAR